MRAETAIDRWGFWPFGHRPVTGVGLNMGKINSITILGSSSGRNAGDAALLSGIMDCIDTACGSRMLYEIPTYRPPYIWHNYQNKVRPISMLPWHGTVGMLGVPTFNSIRRSKVTIIYDAMLFDRKLFNPLTNYMSSAWLYLKYLRARGSIVGFYNVGVGPVTTPWGKKMLKELAELADFITVREVDSYNLLKDMGIDEEKMLITADNAIPVSASGRERIREILSSLSMPCGEEIVAININSYLNSWAGLGQQTLTADSFIKTYASALNRFLQEVPVPVLFVATQHSDVAVTEKLLQAVQAPKGKAIFSNVKYNHHDVKGVLEHVSMLFGMRLHANILATSARTPAVALVFQQKVKSYFDLLGLPENVMSFDDFSENALLEQLRYGWSNREAIRERLAQVIPVLSRETAKSAEIIAAIDRGEDIRATVQRLKEQGQYAVTSRQVGNG
jgi:polysaccharide pyruvyl transferase WcaK-like protein